MLAAGCGFGQGGRAPKKAPSKAPATVAAAARWPVESVVVEGLHYYTREQVLAVAGLKVGQMAGKREFEAARDRLVASGAFETVGYKFMPAANAEGYVATIQVTEIEQAYPVRFEDLHVSSRDLAEVLRQKDPLFSMEHLAATQPVLERYARWVQEFLASKGVTEKIAGSVASDEPGELAVVFRPERSLPAVAQVTFEGNQVLPESALREAVAPSAIGMPYTEQRFREMLNVAIRPLYEARGRVRVHFPEIRTEPAVDVQGLQVLVTVDEGESYNLGKVAVEGPTPVSPEALLKEGDIKTGDVANFDKVAEGVERMRKAVRRAGYMDAKVTTERKVDEGKKAVDVAVHVSPGPLYAMGELTIVGLDLDGEAEMNRIWTLKEGKPFNPEYPDLFLNRVKEQGMFDNLGKTKAELKVNPQNHTVDVTLNFAGDKPGRKGRGGRGA